MQLLEKQMNTNRINPQQSSSRKLAYALSFLLAAIAPFAMAGELSTPHEFVAGTKARAAEVNENFSAVETEVNDNNSRLLTVEGQISDHDTRLSDVEANKLDVSGGTITGGLNVDQVIYNDYHYYTLSIPPEAFRPARNVNYECDFEGCAITEASAAPLIAPLMLPDDARLDQVTLIAIDESDSDDLRLRLYRRSYSEPLNPALIAQTASSGRTSYGYGAFIADITHIIDNDAGNYFLEVGSTPSSWRSYPRNLILTGVVIEYSMNAIP